MPNAKSMNTVIDFPINNDELPRGAITEPTGASPLPNPGEVFTPFFLPVKEALDPILDKGSDVWLGQDAKHWRCAAMETKEDRILGHQFRA